MAQQQALSIMIQPQVNCQPTMELYLCDNPSSMRAPSNAAALPC